MTIKFSDITGGGIPYGNNAGRPANPGIGKLYSNGEAQRLELYTGPQYGWQNIVAETPGVTGYTGTILESNSTNTITITGTNFSSGAVATLVGSDGTEVIATTTTVNNLTSITAVFGPIPADKDPYDIRITNPSNLYGVYYDILTVNDRPVWSTAAGSLGSFNEGSSVSATVSATDEEGNPVTYSSSNLPEWLSLNSSSGALTGTAPSVSADTTYSFNISASDGVNTSSSRSFSLVVSSVLSWNTPSGSLATVSAEVEPDYTYQLSATGIGNTLSYSLLSGSLPSGLTINSSGLISGTLQPVQSSTTSSFTVRVSDGDKQSDRSFSITVRPPIAVSFTYTGSEQYFNVPAGTEKVRAKMWGAAGAQYNAGTNLNNRGGAGGYTETTFNILPGESQLTVIVGGGRTGNNGGGYAGGGGGVNGGSGGGGLSAILSGNKSGCFTTTTYLQNASTPTAVLTALSGASGVIAVAGGGGGAGWYTVNNQFAGNGGGLVGGSGSGFSSPTGGNQTSGGSNNSQANAANRFIGSSITQNFSGGGSGGGGGGWYGGGAHQGANEQNSAGGGGSGFIGYVNGSTSTVLSPNQADSASYIDSITRANGSRTYTSSKCLRSSNSSITPPNTSDSYYESGIAVPTYYPGNDGDAKSSGNGKVVILY